MKDAALIIISSIIGASIGTTAAFIYVAVRGMPLELKDKDGDE